MQQSEADRLLFSSVVVVAFSIVVVFVIIVAAQQKFALFARLLFTTYESGHEFAAKSVCLKANSQKMIDNRMQQQKYHYFTCARKSLALVEFKLLVLCECASKVAAWLSLRKKARFRNREN